MCDTYVAPAEVDTRHTLFCKRSLLWSAEVTSTPPVIMGPTGFVTAAALLAAASCGHAFAPRQPASICHGTTAAPIETRLCMNKKKKTSKKKTTGGKGFGGGGVSALASPSTAVSDDFPVMPKAKPNFRYAGTIKPGAQSARRVVPTDRIQKIPDYANDGIPKNRPALFPWVIETKSPEEIEKMRASGRCAREVLDMAGRAVKPGVTT